MKQKTVWYCSECGHKALKWLGQCPSCNAWSTLQEEVEVAKLSRRFLAQPEEKSRPYLLKEVVMKETKRLKTAINEFDRLIGGGIVPGSLTLIGGDPGIGKSTLMLQLSSVLAIQGLTVLYVCGEESIEQTSLRAQRLGVDTENLYLLNETNVGAIQAQVEAITPDILIVDSIQIVYKSEITSAPGSVSQVREAASEFMHLAKGKNIATFLIGHVTKSGEIAGPRILEHLVDTVLYFEGDKQHNYRMIRVVKNRFGPTDEIAVFQMCTEGLKEIPNPSKMFLEERSREVIGSSIIPTLEGSRPFLVEVQALVTKTVFPTPSRRCAGIDSNRLALLLAVMEKRMGFPLFQQDVFVSIAGGIRITEPSIDLGVIVAIASSLKNKRVDPHTIFSGEVGLSGEVRAVARIESRIKEAVNMGFHRCIIPKRNVKGIPSELKKSIEIVGIEVVEEAVPF